MDSPLRLTINWNGKGRYADYIRLRKEMREWLEQNLKETTFLISSFDVLFAYEEDLLAFLLRFQNDLYTGRRD